jgi:nucleoside-diphosphate-sugar epimerase
MLAIDARVDDYLTLNICGPNSFRYVDVAPRVAKALRRETVDLTLRSFHPYAIDTARAERQLGFRAEYDIDAMVDEALRERVEANG